jgi:hypothetical protein
MPERITMFEEFWKSWPKSQRKGGKATCQAKWVKLKLDLQADQIIKHVEWMKTTDQWKKGDGAFIPSPLVYINQMRWDGAEIPDMTVNVNVNLRDPALAKIEEDTRNVAPMPSFVRDYIARLTKK